MDVWTHKEHASALAASQAGRVAYWQLTALGIGRGRIEGWIRSGLLIPRLPKIYAFGNAAQSYLAELWEAVLYAGPGAMLSHGTAGHWRGLLNYPPRKIHVSTPRQVRRSPPGVQVHPRRALPREKVKGVPATLLPQTVLDIAATEKPNVVGHALAQLDYAYALNFLALNAMCRSGRPGSTALRTAMKNHDPNLAKLNDEAEITLYPLIMASSITPKPEPGFQLEDGVELDSYFPGLRLAYEVNGRGAHHSAAQQIKDADKALACQRHGIKLVWFAAVAVFHRPDQVLDAIGKEVAAAKRTAA